MARPRTKPADQRAIGAADAAEDDGGEDQEEHLEAEIGIEGALDHGEHDAADAASAPARIQT